MSTDGKIYGTVIKKDSQEYLLSYTKQENDLNFTIVNEKEYMIFFDLPANDLLFFADEVRKILDKIQQEDNKDSK